MRGLAPLIFMLAGEFVARHDVGYDEALDCIYRSKLMEGIQDSRTTYSNWAPKDLLDLYDRTEWAGRGEARLK